MGHAGTLDPFATGLLIVALNNATKTLSYIEGQYKTYEACSYKVKWLPSTLSLMMNLSV